MDLLAIDQIVVVCLLNFITTLETNARTKTPQHYHSIGTRHWLNRFYTRRARSSSSTYRFTGDRGVGTTHAIPVTTSAVAVVLISRRWGNRTKYDRRCKKMRPPHCCGCNHCSYYSSRLWYFYYFFFCYFQYRRLAPELWNILLQNSYVNTIGTTLRSVIFRWGYYRNIFLSPSSFFLCY